MEDKKIFDEFPEVDCNGCESYWNNQCDGAVKGTEKRCTAFKATRRVDIPEQIKALRKSLKTVCWGCILGGIAMVMHLLSHMFGG